MADLSSPREFPEDNNNSYDEVSQLNRVMERIIEDVENMSVQLTCMAYDMVALRTSPALGASMRRLEEAHQRCRAAVRGEEQCPETADAALARM